MAESMAINDQKGYYTIFAPGTIQSDYDYAVGVTVHDREEPVSIKVTILGPSYYETKTVEVLPFSSEIVQFSLPPQLPDGDYLLQTEGIRGLIFEESSKLNFKNEKPKVYIQTDKAKYKPGDLMQFRILALDENARPAKLKVPLTLGICDGSRNRIKQIKDLQIIKGVYTGTFQFSEQPVLGNWIIDVTAGEENISKAEKMFEVAKYTLPKFSVEIEADREISVLDKIFKITVRSKYTYGRPVNGIATITVKFKPNTAQKTIDIQGKGEVTFNLTDVVKIEDLIEYRWPEIKVEAAVTEAFTGIQQGTTFTIKVRRSRYTITIPNLCEEYEINKPFEIKALIKKLNGSAVTNAKSSAKLIYGEVLIFESKVDQNGLAVFKLNLTKANRIYPINVMYEEETQPFGLKTETHQEVGSLTTFLRNRKPKLGDELTIDVKFDIVVSYYVYAIVCRGKILKHEYVKVDAVDTKCHSVNVKATFEMVPRSNIFAYSVKNGVLHFYQSSIVLPNTFENMLEITAPEHVKPSDIVTLNIKTHPNSFVGLLGVDQSVVLLKSGNDFDETCIFSDLNCYESRTERGRISSFSGNVLQTNAVSPANAHSLMGLCRRTFSARSNCAYSTTLTSSKRNDNVAVEPKIRKDFVENWIFENIESTDSNGLASFTKKIPDTITSWVITGFSLNENTGFGMTQGPTTIRVFQPFFLSTNLPYSIKRGEVITIPVVVFNYMETSLDAEITMNNEDGEYDFINESIADDKNPNQITKKLTITSNNAETVSFTIKPKIVGEIMLKIKAITPLAGDALLQKLKVEPEGVIQHQNEALFIAIPTTGEPVKHTLKANIPSDVVSDSEYLEFMAVGDIIGPPIKNIDQLVRMPRGCGEQNMINFVPNILVLQYLEAIAMDLPSIKQKAKTYMETGYQRELTYKHKDGSYSAFGEGRDEANSWLTAYVARSFIQARKFITIDEKIIDQALQYLIKTQMNNGQFPQTGKLFYASNQNELGVSAFILLALLEDKEYALKYQTQIDKALHYLVCNVGKEDNIYALALILLAFQKAKHPHAEKIKKKLELKSKIENNLKWWSNSSRCQNNDIEVTAYILQSLVETEEAAKLLPIMKWLIGQRNSLGGFRSTQDTVVGLKALIAFAEKYATGGVGDCKMMIQFEAQNEEGSDTTTGKFNLDKENSFLLQSHVLPKSTRQVTLTAEGEGSALIQLSYRYNIATSDREPSFLIMYTAPDPELFPGLLSMYFRAEYQPKSKKIRESNMAVMEICLPSGYTTHNDSLQPIRNTASVKRVEIKNEHTVIVVYIDSIVAGEAIIFPVSADKTHAVDELKPAAVTVYDYYNIEQRATVYYDI